MEAFCRHASLADLKSLVTSLNQVTPANGEACSRYSQSVR